MRCAKFAFLIVAVVLAALGTYQIALLHRKIERLETGQRALEQKLAESELASWEEGHVVIFLVKSTPTDFHLVPINRVVMGVANPTAALNALLAGPLDSENLEPAVPPTTRLLGLSVHRGLATVNFSSEIIRDFNGGALIESYLIQAVVNTLTEFPEIDRVQFLVEGEPVESIGGHILITEPIARSR